MNKPKVAGRGPARHPSPVSRNPASAGRPDPKLVADLVAANRILARENVLDGWGHVSVRHNLDPGRYLLSRSLAPEFVSAGDILEFDRTGLALPSPGEEPANELAARARKLPGRG